MKNTRHHRVAALAVVLAAASGAVGNSAGAQITLSVVGTNDLHGRLFTDAEGRGGLEVLGGYIDNLRAARAADGGAVLLFDAGDTFQGGIESNLSEGLMVVDAYNALGYTALAIGNHDFDYGPVDPRGAVTEWLAAPAPEDDRRDQQGALKAAAARARFPFLAANTLDAAGKPVHWPNVAPAALVTAAGVRVGIIGAMTETGLKQTLAAHVIGLANAPLVPSIAREAAKLRAQGAEIVLLVTHAGGWCGETADPRDLSSCDGGAEIFRVAHELPAGTLQGIVAGHTHGTVAHFVDDVPIISVPNFGVAFGRMDLVIDASSRRLSRVDIHAPQRICSRVASGACAVAPAGKPAEYEGAPVMPSARVAAAIAPELERVHALRAQPLGVVVDTPLTRSSEAESAIGNLYADALRAAVPDADVALSYGPGRGGLRTDLPVGPVTFGAVYDVFPFDNRITRVELTGAQLARVLEEQLPQLVDGRRGLLAISGLRATVACDDVGATVSLAHQTGEPVAPAEKLVVAAASFSAGRAAWAALEHELAASPRELPLLVRDAAMTWLVAHGGHVGAADFVDPARRATSTASRTSAAPTPPPRACGTTNKSLRMEMGAARTDEKLGKSCTKPCTCPSSASASSTIDSSRARRSLKNCALSARSDGLPKNCRY
jgi:5'-nucleotidase